MRNFDEFFKTLSTRQIPFFDEFWNSFPSQLKEAEKHFGYPPINIKKEGDNRYVIETAVAGFGHNQVTVDVSGDVLTIEGKSEDAPETDEYLYKGIASRSFKRQFKINDKVEVKDATLVNGMLRVYLEGLNSMMNSKQIPIKTSPSQGDVLRK